MPEDEQIKSERKGLSQAPWCRLLELDPMAELGLAILEVAIVLPSQAVEVDEWVLAIVLFVRPSCRTFHLAFEVQRAGILDGSEVDGVQTVL